MRKTRNMHTPVHTNFQCVIICCCCFFRFVLNWIEHFETDLPVGCRHNSVSIELIDGLNSNLKHLFFRRCPLYDTRYPDTICFCFSLFFCQLVFAYLKFCKCLRALVVFIRFSYEQKSVYHLCVLFFAGLAYEKSNYFHIPLKAIDAMCMGSWICFFICSKKKKKNGINLHRWFLEPMLPYFNDVIL